MRNGELKFIDICRHFLLILNPQRFVIEKPFDGVVIALAFIGEDILLQRRLGLLSVAKRNYDFLSFLQRRFGLQSVRSGVLAIKVLDTFETNKNPVAVGRAIYSIGLVGDKDALLFVVFKNLGDPSRLPSLDFLAFFI